MKKQFRSLLVAISLVLVTIVGIKATDDTATITGATITSLLQGQFHLQSLEVINNHPTNPVTFYFYDAPTNLLTWARGAFSNWTTYTTNIVVTITNYNGVVETSTNLATYTIPNANATNVANYKKFKTFTVAAGGSSSWTPVNGIYLSYGMAVTNSDTNVTVNYSYSSVR